MANQHGDFIWYELLTKDADAAARFYGAVVGWQMRAAEGSDRGYRIFSIRGEELKRIPKPWDDTHPRALLLRKKALSASKHHEPAEWMHSAALLDRVVDGFRAVRPLNGWLDTHVGPKER